MKKISTMILLGVLLLSALVGCSDNNHKSDPTASETKTDEMMKKYPAKEIDTDTDVCAICAMAVADDQHATQIVLTNDRVLTFDDLGCLYQWIEENGEEEIGAKYVRDFHSQEWVLMDQATYVFDEHIETPMAYGVISFKEADEAKKYIEKEAIGEILSVDELAEHKWEMMHHNHDHHHDEFEEDEHDEHGHHNEDKEDVKNRS